MDNDNIKSWGAALFGFAIFSFIVITFWNILNALIFRHFGFRYYGYTFASMANAWWIGGMWFFPIALMMRPKMAVTLHPAWDQPVLGFFLFFIVSGIVLLVLKLEAEAYEHNNGYLPSFSDV